MTSPSNDPVDLIARGLFSEDAATRKKARASLAAHPDAKVAAHFAGDKRNVQSMSDGAKLAKLLVEYEKVGVDGFRVAMELLASQKPDPRNGIGGLQYHAAFEAALRYAGREPEVFEAVADVPEIYLPGPKKTLPPGLSKLRALRYLRVPEGRLDTAANLDELAQIPQRFRLSLWVKDVKLSLWNAAAERVSGLDLRGAYSNLSDASPLSAWRNLDALDLEHTSVADLAPLRGMALTQLRVGETKVADLSVLSSIPTLRDLGLRRLPVADLSPVWTLTALETLDLSFASLRDLTPLRALTRLKHLDLWGTAVDSFEPLVGLPLERLEMNHVARPDLTPLARIPSLRTIYMTGGSAPMGLDTLRRERPDVHVVL